MLEPLVLLAAAAAATRRIRLLTSVLLGPTRETSLLARQAATLDGLSGGRLVLGLGIGIRDDDYRASGTTFNDRGRRFDGQLATLRRAWSEEAADDPATSPGPPPSRTGGPELLIGGYVDAVARRIATWGDGFMAPGGGRPEDIEALWERILGAWTEAGRAGRPRRVAGTYFALGPRAEEHARGHIDAWYGFDPALAEGRLRGIPVTVDGVRAAIRRQSDLGVDEIVLRACGADLDQIDRLADLVTGA
jgi:alkanesulfonate monooxygenase SsuD/methylene tetrahydromethanopterin reductase-like flavin-dependent oxidoreductase (luciferase family)